MTGDTNSGTDGREPYKKRGDLNEYPCPEWIIAKFKTPKGERSIRRYCRNRKNKGTLTRTCRVDTCRGDPGLHGVGKSAKLISTLSEEELHIYLLEMEFAIVALSKIVFQLSYDQIRE